jgi:3-phosphoshikimate 1-carboxyvinyltransferase
VRIRITPGERLSGTVTVPGDKSIAHRWLLLAATASGSSRLVELPSSFDVCSMASCLAAVSGSARPALEAWASNDAATPQGHGSTWNLRETVGAGSLLEVQGEGRGSLVPPVSPLDCGNSGTAMRLLAGVLAGAPFHSVLTGDHSLSSRPMERVAAPLRAMGAAVATEGGHAPISIDGGPLHAIAFESPVPSAQLKGAVLLAGLVAQGRTTVREAVPTRDHTERALRALGAPIEVRGREATVEPFQHEGFEARCPGDPSSAAFLVAAAALTGSAVNIAGVGLNPSRLHFLDVLRRMGVETHVRVEREELGEPVGELRVDACEGLRPARVDAEELPLVIDEVPVLAVLAAHAPGETRILGAGELRHKESDRLAAVVNGVRELGGQAAAEGDDLVIAGGGLNGGVGRALGDHRMAMAFTVAALAAREPCEVEGMESADVSFPGFVPSLQRMGAGIEVLEP